MKILVAFDGSEGARAALRSGIDLARAANAELLAMHVLDPRADAGDVVAPTTEQAMEQVSAAARKALSDAIAEADGVAAEVAIGEVRRGDDVPETLARAAREQGADILVISSRRASGVAGLLLGSVTQQVLRLSPCPVLVVRP